MALENEILQLTKHSLVLDDVVIVDNESESEEGIKTSKFLGAYYPFVEINKYEFALDSILSFELSNSGFLPVLALKVADTDGLFLSRHFALDGAVINFYIRANNEAVFKPIHINFDILEISPSGTNNSGNPLFYIKGQMKVPNLYTEFNKAYSEMSSFDTLATVAGELKLGFASNVESTNDVMTWLNPFDTNLKFIKDTTSNAFLDETSFFTSFIDNYYNLNFIDVNRSFNKKDILVTEIYSAEMPDLNKEIDFEVLPMFYTNHRKFNDTSRYIGGFKLVNNTGSIFLKNGYSRTFQYYDSISNQYISDTKLEPLTGIDDILNHLKGRFINGSSEGLQNQYVKYKYLGKQNENMHDMYLYSSLFNFQNIQESNKMLLEVTLLQTDMSIYRYQTILIQIFDYDTMVQTIKKDNVPEEESMGDSDGVLNNFLSGHYVIRDIEYKYLAGGQMYQKMYLMKREFNNPL